MVVATKYLSHRAQRGVVQLTSLSAKLCRETNMCNVNQLIIFFIGERVHLGQVVPLSCCCSLYLISVVSSDCFALIGSKTRGASRFRPRTSPQVSFFADPYGHRDCPNVPTFVALFIIYQQHLNTRHQAMLFFFFFFLNITPRLKMMNNCGSVKHGLE